MQNAYETPRPLAELLPDLKEWAAENGCAGAFDGVRHRQLGDAALDDIFPSERINNRRYYRRSRRDEIARKVLAHFGAFRRQPASDLASAA